jgi:hypothetical protein
MSEYPILRSQKNEILNLIKESELDPFNFIWRVGASKYTHTDSGVPVLVSRLSYDGTEYYFQFDFVKEQHYAIFSPGGEKLVEEQYPGSWISQLSSVWRWLTFLKREIEQPDLWAELAKYQLPPGEQISSGIGNEPFTAQQADQIIEGLRKVRAYLEAEFDFNEQQQKLVDEKLDYLMGAAKRQGRKDWLHTSIGVIFTLATALALSPEQAKTIWNILKVAVSGIIQLLQ